MMGRLRFTAPLWSSLAVLILLLVIPASTKSSSGLHAATQPSIPMGMMAFNCHIAPVQAMTDICVSQLDGSHLRRLTRSRADESYPVWSPDGTRILYRVDRSCTNCQRDDIYVMNVDGSHQTNLTHNLRAGNWGARWSPDGSRIVFNSIRQSPSPQLYVMNADGSNVTRLSTSTVWGEYPDWSPDGAKIVYMATFFDASGQNSDIFVMDTDGSHIKRLTDRPGEDGGARWSPVGSRIIWVRGGSEPTEPGLYIMNSDGSGQQRLTGDGFQGVSGNWSPDGTKLIVGVNNPRGQEEGIWLMDPDGSGRIKLRNRGSEPGWRPSGIGKDATRLTLTRTVHSSADVSIQVQGKLTSGGRPLTGVSVAIGRLGAPTGTMIIGRCQMDQQGRFQMRLPVASAATWRRPTQRRALHGRWHSISAYFPGDSQNWSATTFVASGLP